MWILRLKPRNVEIRDFSLRTLLLPFSVHLLLKTLTCSGTFVRWMQFGVTMALILGGVAAAMQWQAMSGYAKLVNDPAPSSPLPPLPVIEPIDPEVCRTKADCVDCKKRPEAPDWWTQNQEGK